MLLGYVCNGSFHGNAQTWQLPLRRCTVPKSFWRMLCNFLQFEDATFSNSPLQLSVILFYNKHINISPCRIGFTLKKLFPLQHPLKTLLASSAKIPLPFLKRSKSTGSATGITRAPSTMPITSASTDITVEKQMSVARSSFAGSSAPHAHPVTRHAEILSGNAVAVWTRPLMSAMAATRRFINVPSPTNMCTMPVLPTVNTLRP